MGTIFHILGWALFGLIVGAIARLLVPGKQAMSWLMTSLLGIVGSLVGGGISWLIWGNPEGTYNPGGWIMSILGAILVVLIYSRVTAGRAAG
ncbi:MAG TPA: GlsB/YeaQ/YmgE family stress response membrane protein [Gemmataceae bacterium]|nr:GlsB/YeaQ/YmgE family stress response membrane protein [Gemmataceae bacterium]